MDGIVKVAIRKMRLGFLLLELKVAVQLRLYINNSVEKLLDHVLTVRLKCLVELLELSLSVLVHSSLTR